MSDRVCCKCRILGKSVQIHHIDEDPSNNDPQNFAVLCLECHDETQVIGGFGRRLSAGQVRLYRDDWLARVEERRSATPQQIPIATAPNQKVSEKDKAFVLQARAEQRQRFRDAALVMLNAATEYKSVAHQLGFIFGGETRETRNQRLSTSLQKALSPVDDAVMSLTVEGKAERILDTLREIRTAYFRYSDGLETNRQFHGTYTVEYLQRALNTIDAKVEELTKLIQERLSELAQPSE